MNKIFLTKKISIRISKGHDWIFDHEIAIKEGECLPGSIVRVFTHTGSFLGIGLYNPFSKIAVRIIEHTDNDVDFEGLFRGIFYTAITLRRDLYFSMPFFRIFHSECDGLSGLLIDQFGKYVVVQLLTYGLEVRKEMIRRVIQQELGMDYHILFDESNSLRKYENLNVRSDSFESFVVDGPLYRFYYQNKSFYSVERRELYEFAGRLSHNKVVWDLFSGAGHFSLHALSYNAKEIVAVDNNEGYLDIFKSNLALNGLSDARLRITEENVFDYFKSNKHGGQKPDVIIIDPPVFNIKDNLLKPYKELILQAFRVLKPQSYLIAGFQSTTITAVQFENIISDAALDVRRKFIVLKKFSNPPDLPIDRIYAHSDNFHFWAIKVH